MNKIETRSLRCSKENKHVNLTSTFYEYSADQATGVVGRKLIKFECSNQMECAFDWKNCPHYPNKEEL